MNTWGASVLGFAVVGLFLGACGGAATPPANAPSSTTTSSGEAPQRTAKETPPPVKEEAAPKEAEATPVAAVAPAPAAEPTPEPCDGEWICLRVEDGKVSKRTTRLIGDPKIESTWSKNTDGRSPASFDEATHPVDLVLKHIPGKPGQHLAHIVLRPKSGGEILLDKRDGDDFGYVGVIAAEQDGAFLVDLRYMK